MRRDRRSPLNPAGLLEGKRVVVTGVLTPASIAYAVADAAQRQGAELVLTGAGRGLRITRRTAARLAVEPPVIPLDVTDEDDLAAFADRLRAIGWDRVDGLVHSIAFADPRCMGSGLLAAGWDDVGAALRISAYSLKALAEAVLPLVRDHASIVGFDFDAAVAWPGYDWMGVAKAALESIGRYLARDLGPAGVRVNLVASGPLRTPATALLPGFTVAEAAWAEAAPLGWDPCTAAATAQAAVVLLSDWLPATTGEIIHVDGGRHAVA